MQQKPQWNDLKETKKILFCKKKTHTKNTACDNRAQLDPNTFNREITLLKRVNDNYQKFIITMDELSMDDKEIKIINIIDFLLEEYD